MGSQNSLSKRFTKTCKNSRFVIVLESLKSIWYQSLFMQYRLNLHLHTVTLELCMIFYRPHHDEDALHTACRHVGVIFQAYSHAWNIHILHACNIHSYILWLSNYATWYCTDSNITISAAGKMKLPSITQLETNSSNHLPICINIFKFRSPDQRDSRQTNLNNY